MPRCPAALDGSLVVEPGSFDVMIGASSRDIRLHVGLDVCGKNPGRGPSTLPSALTIVGQSLA